MDDDPVRPDGDETPDEDQSSLDRLENEAITDAAPNVPEGFAQGEIQQATLWKVEGVIRIPPQRGDSIQVERYLPVETHLAGPNSIEEVLGVAHFIQEGLTVSSISRVGEVWIKR